MNFGASTIAAQASRPLSLVAVLSLLVGCGGGYQPAIPAPADPAATIRAFLAAATVNNLRDMSALWGTERGPAERSIPRDDLEKRLTVMRTYLQHDSYEILPSDVPVLGRTGRRLFEVGLERRGCRPVVPFTLVPWDDGWLVVSVDLAAAGNPAQRCSPGNRRPQRPPEGT